MFFENLEARRLMSVVQAGTLNGVTVTQSGSGTLTIKASTAANLSVIEAGTRNDFLNTIGSNNSGLIAVVDGMGGEVVYGGVNLNKPVTIQMKNGDGSLLFDGNLHNAAISGGSSGIAMLTAIDEGNGGTVVKLGKQDNTVNVPFSHHITITDGGGNNHINLNTDFNQSANPDAQASGGTATASNQNQNNPGTESVNVNGDQTQDLITVQVGGGGANTISDYAGNLKVTTGSGSDTLFVQSSAGSTVVNTPPGTYQTNWIDVISDKGIDQIDNIGTMP